MKLVLHSDDSNFELAAIYKQAFTEATRLYVVSAYLTDWDKSLVLNADCEKFRVIVGKDFGITRKSACIDLMKWLSAERKSQFLVADSIEGFHPKAVFWIDKNKKAFSIIGSSNLTKAAFGTNYEANIYSEISNYEFIKAEKWMKEIEDRSVVVSEDWLAKYKEATPSPKKTINSKSSSVFSLILPTPVGSAGRIKERRVRLAKHQSVETKLHALFLQCSKGKISSSEFYERLPSFWSWKVGNRLQGSGWERKGKNSNLRELSSSFINILNSNHEDRDDIVVREFDRLEASKNPARRAFLSEMLCLTFPEEFPILNRPVNCYLKAIKFRPPKGASKGAKYIDLAKKLRASLAQNPKHLAKNIAELDTVIWLEYKD